MTSIPEFVNGNVFAELCFQRLKPGEDLRLAVRLLKRRFCPHLHQQQGVGILRVEKVIILDIAGLAVGMGADAQRRDGLEEFLPLSGLAVLGDVPG